MNKRKKLTGKLNAAISTVTRNFSDYCINPGSDFTRTRKLDAECMIRSILSMTDYSLREEIHHYWKFHSNAPTKSAFIQQRQKILPDAFRAVFDEFSGTAMTQKKNFKGYRLLACDGTAVNLPRNPSDTITSVHAKPTASSYNILHINALYDLMNSIYTDYVIDYGMDVGESKALLQMAAKLPNPGKTIIVADRGYGYLGPIYNLDAMGLKFVLRVKDILSNNFLSQMNLPDTEFDLVFSKILTCNRKKKYFDDPKYIVVSKQNGLDFTQQDEYSISFRVCRFMLPSGGYECLVTNLPPDDFPVDALKQTYHMRWGIETSFRDLKYSIGLMYFHAKKLNSILQEIHAAMIMMNYCSLMVQAVTFTQKDSWKYAHKINFAAAVGCCRSFFSSGENGSLNLILRDQSLVRQKRRYDRYLHDTKPAKSFTYRVS